MSAFEGSHMQERIESKRSRSKDECLVTEPVSPDEGSVSMAVLRTLLAQREQEHRDTVAKLKELTVDFDDKRTALTTSAVRLEGAIVNLREILAKGSTRG